MRTLSMAVLAGLGFMLLGGCSQTYKVEFVNMTHNECNVELRLPDTGPMRVGTVHKFGDRLVKKVTIADDDLPMNVEWTAGDVCGNVNFEKHGPHDIPVMIGEKNGGDSGGGNHSSHSEIRTEKGGTVHDEKEKTTKETHIIVE